MKNLPKIGHHYEVEEISDVRIVESSTVSEKTIKAKVSFDTAVTIYLDYEDETGVTMTFPTQANVEFDKDKSRKWEINEDKIKLHFDTSKYYM